jgi:FliI/YscN family ATPase
MWNRTMTMRGCERIRTANPCPRVGTLQTAIGTTLEADLPGVHVGEQVLLGAKRQSAEVIGFRGNRVLLLPMGKGGVLKPGMPVFCMGRPMRISWSEQMVGRVIDVQGRPMDGMSSLSPSCTVPLLSKVPDPLKRKPICEVMATGVRAIDGLVTLGKGQRMGLYAGPGVGKSTLLGQITRFAKADCTVVCLVGERGREVREFVEQVLGEEGRRRSVVVCSTSDAPAGERALALPVATAVADGFRKRGKSVLLVVDSLTRHVRALREIALSAGEPPGRRGFPASVFDRLAMLLECVGNDASGSITAIYTVLVEGEPNEDPVAQETRALLDGHIVLDPGLAGSGCFPAIDPCTSLSRLMNGLVSKEHREIASEARALWSAFERRKDLIAAGAYQAGSEPLTDRAIRCRPLLEDFIRQERQVEVDQEDVLGQLKRAVFPS